MEAVGRPSGFSKDQLTDLKKLYYNNISAPKAAAHFGVSRQVVYYYYKRFKADGEANEPVKTVTEVLRRSACMS
jgi:transposase